MRVSARAWKPSRQGFGLELVVHDGSVVCEALALCWIFFLASADVTTNSRKGVKSDVYAPRAAILCTANSALYRHTLVLLHALSQPFLRKEYGERRFPRARGTQHQRARKCSQSMSLSTRCPYAVASAVGTIMLLVTYFIVTSILAGTSLPISGPLSPDLFLAPFADVLGCPQPQHMLSQRASEDGWMLSLASEERRTQGSQVEQEGG